MDGKKSEGDLRQLADDITANDCRNAAILLGGKRLDDGRSHQSAQICLASASHFIFRSAAAAEPSSDFSHDFVDLVGLQKSRFLFQLRPPSHQNLILSLLLVVAFVGNLLDDSFPSLKTHRFSFLEVGPPHAQRLFHADGHDRPCLGAA
jgi:hypothetical protein